MSIQEPTGVISTIYAGKGIGPNGVSVASAFKYWLTKLRVGNRTMPASGFIADGFLVNIPAEKGVYAGAPNAADYNVQIVALTKASNFSYIDFTLPSFDYKGRLLYNTLHEGFTLTALTSNFHFNVFGALGFGGNIQDTAPYGTSGAYLWSGGATAPPFYTTYSASNGEILLTDYTAPESHSTLFVGTTGSTYTDYYYTVPANSKRIEITVIGHGGAGGTAVAQATPGPNDFSYALGGGGGSASWLKFSLNTSVFTPGTILNFRMAGSIRGTSTDTQIFVNNFAGTLIGGVRPGLPGSNVNGQAVIGTGGGTNVPYLYAGTLLDYGSGQQASDPTFEKSFALGSYRWSGRTGGGADSRYGSRARAISYSLGTGAPLSDFLRLGEDAQGYGAGAEGGTVMTYGAAVLTRDGGFGSPSVAKIIAYYQ